MTAKHPSADPEATRELLQSPRPEPVEGSPPKLVDRPRPLPVEGSRPERAEARSSTGSDRVTANSNRAGPIVLVGAPGSGKSTVGALLAERLGMEFVDVDAVIEERIGKSVAEIFADDGEPAFRKLEEDTTAEQLRRPGVLALGGGAVLSAATRKALRDHQVVWLRVGVPAALHRVGLDTARPLLLGNVRGRLIKLLGERTPLYDEVAVARVDTDDSRPEEVVDAIVRIWPPEK
jgi:shikimate kinase